MSERRTDIGEKNTERNQPDDQQRQISSHQRLLGDRIGALELGKFADIIAVDGDPLKDVHELTKVKFVMKGGRVIRNDLTPTASK